MDFLTTYRDDLIALFKAFVDFIKALFEKFGASPDADETTGE